ncbi:MAG: acetylglutamate kinase [archaeon]|jgi:acetylglutamate kinase
MASQGVIVFKIGGEILGTPELLTNAIKEIVAVKKRFKNIKIVLVHGAGPQLDKSLAEASIPFKKINGKRVTSKEGMNVIWNVVRRESNDLAERLIAQGVKAQTPDYPVTILAKIKDKKLGLVGTPIGINLESLKKVFREQAIPIVSICGCTKKGQIVNVNADEVASMVAIGTKAKLLELKTNTPGVLKNGKTIPRIFVKEIAPLIRKKVVDGGMLVKVNAAKKALQGGVKRVRISNVKSKGTTLHLR